MNYYTYTILFVDGYYYHGYHKHEGVDPLTDGYYGSPVTHREKWLTTMHWKVITGTYESHAEVQFAEQESIRPVFRRDPLCLNANCGGIIDPERARVGATKAGRIAGERSKVEKTGVCDPVNSGRGRQTQRELGLGFWDPEFQQSDLMKQVRRQNGVKGGVKAVESGQLAKARENIDAEKRRETAKETARKMEAEGRGLGSIPFEVRSKRSTEVVKKTNSSKWMDPAHPELGVHNPGNLSKLQRKFGYPSGKETRTKVG
jgi:hypothetical protein